ncbi:hypothetical protein JCM3774_005075 [Rhodotorula dairenensis]
MLIDGVKYSCDACTRGHRQNSCKHADRPLHEVPKRGRPPTACAECRELRKTTNSHRTCNHRKDSDEGPDLLFKSLPNGAGDLATVELVRRSSSIKSRSSASAASVASTSAASASEDDLASVGRRKSISRTSSLSRPGSSARSEKAKKPHDLAHGHLADHPTHVSAAYSPYPHHPPNKDHHHHHHHMHIPSPLARSEGGGSSGRGTGATNSPVASGSGVPPVPPLPPLPAFSEPPILGKLTARQSAAPSALANEASLPLPARPPPALLPSAPPPPLRPQQAIPDVKAELPTPVLRGAFPAPPPPILPPPPPPPSVPVEAPMSNEQLASAFFFRDFPPEARSASHSPNASQYERAAGSTALPTDGDRDRDRASNPSPRPRSPIKHETPAGLGSYPRVPSQQLEPVLTNHQNGYYASPPLISPATSLESLAAIDPAAAAYVLGTGAERIPPVPLAPMYGEGDLYYSDSGPLPVDDEQTYDACPSSSNGGDGYVDYRNVPPTSSSASSDIYERPPPPSTHPGLSDRPPLEAVPSRDLSSYSGYESAASVTGGAAAALERLDLDFDLPRRTPPVPVTAAVAAAAEGQQRPPPPRLDSSGASSSAASAAVQFMPGEDVQTTDLDGILEWLASSNAAGGLPPPPPSSRGEPNRNDSAASSVATWPSAPPSSYGDSVGAGYGVGAMYGIGAGWTSYSESEMQPRYSPPVPVSSSSASASGQAPPQDQTSGGGGGNGGGGGRTGGVTWATRSDEDVGGVKEEVNSAGERVGGPRKRERNADLEMLRTATITCRDASFSASASDSPDHAGGDPNAWDSTRANSPRLDPGGSGSAAAPRYARGHAFAAFIGDEFDRFGLGGELDDDWFRQFGVGSGLAGLAGGIGGEGLGDGEGEIGEDDGYEEDDEASVVGGGGGGFAVSTNPFDGDGFGDGYERDYDYRGGGGGGGDLEDELGWDRDVTFGAGPLASSSDELERPSSSPDVPDRGGSVAIDVVQPSASGSSRSDPDHGPYDDGRRDHDDDHGGGGSGGPELDLAPTSPTSPTSRLAAYLEQQEAKNEEDGHDRGAGMWW